MEKVQEKGEKVRNVFSEYSTPFVRVLGESEVKYLRLMRNKYERESKKSRRK